MPGHYLRRSYNDKARWASYFRQADEVLKLEPESVLEVGIGNGLVASYLRSCGINLSTCDVDRDLKPDAVGSVENLPFGDNSFDVVLCAEVLEHLPFEKLELCLLELYRVSKKYVVVSLPHWGWTFRFLAKIPFFPELKFLWKFSGILKHKSAEHQWEIGKKGFSVRKIIMAAKKIALISIYKDQVRGIPPLGLLYLATALKKNNFEAKIIHKSEKEDNSIEAEIEEFKPDLVGMSVFTGYLNKKYIELSKNLKNKGYLIVWGNAHPSLLPQRILKEKYVDFVVIGEGEETLVELARNIDDRGKYREIDGLGFKDEFGEIVINKRRDFINMDDYLVDWSLINVEEYLVSYFSNRYKRVLALTTSRGCPFSCQFCYNLVFNNRRWRAHSAEALVENLKPVIEKYRIDAIRFLDDNFFVDKERAVKIAGGLGLPYFADSRVEFIDKELVEKLKETKCRELMFGFESGSDRILKDVVKKGTTTKDTVNAVTLLKDSGIIASGSFIFGLPTETEEEYAETMRFIVKLLEINSNLAFTGGWFLPYPGTGLYEKAIELGFHPPDNLEEWDRFDRWRNDYKMEWIGWDYGKAVKYSRTALHLLALSYKRNIPIAKTVFKWRVENTNFSFPLDIFLLSKIRGIYMGSGEKNIIHKLIKKLISKIISRFYR